MNDYAELRAALEDLKPGDGDAMLAYRLASGPEVIRALLAERDAMKGALTEYANPENWEEDEHGWARLWLEPDSTSRRSYDGAELARHALAQNQGD